MCDKSQFAPPAGGENTFFEWMLIDSGPCGRFQRWNLAQKFLLRGKLKEEKKVTSPGNQTKQVSCRRGAIERLQSKVAWEYKSNKLRLRALCFQRFITMESLILAQDER